MVPINFDTLYMFFSNVQNVDLNIFDTTNVDIQVLSINLTQ